MDECIVYLHYVNLKSIKEIAKGQDKLSEFEAVIYLIEEGIEEGKKECHNKSFLQKIYMKKYHVDIGEYLKNCSTEQIEEIGELVIEDISYWQLLKYLA